MHDILITNGRVIDPASGRDEIADVAIADGRVAKIGRKLAPRPRRRSPPAARPSAPD